MINILLNIAEIIVSYLLLMLLSKKYKKEGIYIFAIIAILLSNIINLKQISIMNISVPIGFGITTSIIIGLNILIQQNGKEETNNYLLIILISSISSYLFLSISGLISGSEYNFLANKSFDNIFNNNTRVYFALTLSLLLSLYLDSNLYYIIKKLKNKIILSNIFSIIIVEFFENIIFVLLAYLFNYETLDLILCIIFRYIIKTTIGLFGTIPLYIANKNK